jgi:ubiquinone/menaquinone biosynthesis C-methylase UbiE
MNDVSHLSSAAGQAARRELAIFSRRLKSGEQVVEVCCGTGTDGRSAVIVVTDRRVVYVQRRRLWGADIESVPLARVRGAEDRAGVRHASVVLDAGGRVFELNGVDHALAQVFCVRVTARLRQSS